MRRRGRSSGRIVAAGALVAAGLLAACSEHRSVLEPAAPEAARIADLTWLLFGLAGAVLVLVLGVGAFALLRRERDHAPRWAGVPLVVFGGILLPLGILPVVWVTSLPAMAELDRDTAEATITVDIIARQWAYEVRYENGRVLDNALRLPLDEPVRLRLTSVDVIHSFWIPPMFGKRDMLPGVVTELVVTPQIQGVYGAQCAEFCGLGHAGMRMQVTVESGDQFRAWLEGEG